MWHQQNHITEKVFPKYTKSRLLELRSACPNTLFKQVSSRFNSSSDGLSWNLKATTTIPGFSVSKESNARRSSFESPTETTRFRTSGDGCSPNANEMHSLNAFRFHSYGTVDSCENQCLADMTGMCCNSENTRGNKD
eukprot:CAMPEP_0206376988 /NCGR_PEP_ID=MMETSP0294-20121207/9872_1 /ASSEMBLY_ACC=CAM_ASM_000327 /TAXON_ID=39354 /ORGANISM="Heterosigma akashiwo, Strain CCMP2393" /LENGTH=136 /DNA_ID=CAMNT_0053825343 /DNA_START=374 /DNA_END=781 /DNA_ORIENTATION=-